MGSGVKVPQLPHPSGGVSLMCAFYTISKSLCRVKFQLLAVAAGLLPHPCWLPSFRLSPPHSLTVCLYLSHEVVALKSFFPGLLLQEPKPSHRLLANQRPWSFWLSPVEVCMMYDALPNHALSVQIYQMMNGNKYNHT